MATKTIKLLRHESITTVCASARVFVLGVLCNGRRQRLTLASTHAGHGSLDDDDENAIDGMTIYVVTRNERACGQHPERTRKYGGVGRRSGGTHEKNCLSDQVVGRAGCSNISTILINSK
ncbi:hypothetical protein ACI65C_002116 [Semiaphis heraclei]